MTLGVDVGGLAWCSVGTPWAQELQGFYGKNKGKGGKNQSMGGAGKSSDEGKGMFPHDDSWGTGKSYGKSKCGRNKNKGGTGKSYDDGDGNGDSNKTLALVSAQDQV